MCSGLSDTSSLVINSICTLIGGLGGAVLGARIAKDTAFKIIERQEITRDYITLKNSLLPSRHILQKDKITRDDVIRLAALYEDQITAMLFFVNHLSGENRKTFEERWSKYKKWHQKYEELEAKSANFDLGKLDTAKPERVSELLKIIDDILDAGKKF